MLPFLCSGVEGFFGLCFLPSHLVLNLDYLIILDYFSPMPPNSHKISTCDYNFITLCMPRLWDTIKPLKKFWIKRMKNINNWEHWHNSNNINCPARFLSNRLEPKIYNWNTKNCWLHIISLWNRWNIGDLQTFLQVPTICLNNY